MMNLSPETVELRREWHDIIHILKEKNCQLKIQQKYSPGMNEKSGHPQMKEIKRICHQWTHPKIMANSSSLNGKETAKEGILRH